MLQSKKITSSQHQAPQAQIKNQIFIIFEKLNKQIDVMDLKVEVLLQKHEGEFVLAYQNHVRKIKKDLQTIRQRADQLQKQLKDNNRAVYLQKQAALFRQQSLKLYEKLEQKTQQSQFYKFKAKDLQKTTSIMQKQIRQTLKSRRVVQVKLVGAEKQIKELQDQINEKTQQILNLTEQLTQKNLPLIIPNIKKVRHETQQTNNLNLSLKMKQSTKFTTQSKASLYQLRQKSLSHINSNSDSQLRQWFLQCIKTIKKQIATRKGQPLNILQTVKNINQFMIVDKLRLLQKFLENQKLLVWMYQKIFPPRINQVRQYLSQRKIDISQNHESQQDESNANTNKSQMLIKNNKIQYIQKKQSNATSMNNKVKNNLQKLQSSIQTQRFKVNYHIGNRVSFKQGRLKILNIGNNHSNQDNKI